MATSFLVSAGGQTATTVTPTTLSNPNGPGAVITVVGNGPNATANIVGPQNDATDLWGILVVLAVIGISIAVVRLVFGRQGPRSGPAARRSESGH